MTLFPYHVNPVNLGLAFSSFCRDASWLSRAQGSNEYNKRLGEPVPMPVNLPVVEALTMALRTVEADALGNLCR